mgnify:CR=1 FL=1
MAKLYFKYGAMGSSKTAQALITKFNYEERGMRVWLAKPAIDNRDGELVIQSRIGLKEMAYAIHKDENVYEYFSKINHHEYNVIIIDECQFLTEEQVDQLGRIVTDFDLPVLCFGLRTDFRTRMFPGSKRLFEIAESISEIKTICDCGRKATVNARIDEQGNVLTEGEQVFIGGNESYVAMCYKCWLEKTKNR